MLFFTCKLNKSIVAILTFVWPFSSMNSLMSLHIGFLNKWFATKSTFVFLAIRVNFFMTSQRPRSWIFLVAKFTWQSFELWMGFDMGRQISFSNFFIAHFTLYILIKYIKTAKGLSNQFINSKVNKVKHQTLWSLSLSEQLVMQSVNWF